MSSIKALASVRGEIIFTSRENIEIKEHHVDGKRILTDEPHLLVVDNLSTTFNLIKWFKEWDHHICCEHEGIKPSYTIRMVILPTLNDVYDDPLLHKRYNERKFAELSGESSLSLDGRFKIGRRILYNWFTTSLQHLREINASSDTYIYMEIEARMETEDKT